MKKIALAFSAFMMFSFNAIAGPFGLEMGMTADQIRTLGVTLTPIPNRADWYRTTRAPKHLDDFDGYRLFAPSSTGLCKILASGKDLAINAFGTRLQKEFNSMHDLLVDVYGASKKFDYLKSGSIWSQPEDWTMGLIKEERTLVAYWATEHGLTLKDDISTIQLKAIAIDSSTGYISLGYEFNNFDACISGQEKQKKGVL